MMPTDLSQHVSDYYENQIFSLAPAEKNTPVSLLNTEAACFPTLFPDGRNTFDEEREVSLTYPQYIKSRLLSSDNRFASNIEYIFYLQYIKELKEILSSVQISLKKGCKTTADNKTITADILSTKEHAATFLKKGEGYKYLRSIRGSAPYWEKTTKDLFAMVIQIGIPTWFASFSAADRRWREIPEAIFQQQGKEMNELTWEEHCAAIKSNPVTAALMFERRVNLFLHDVILSKANPIGKVCDHFIRVEFQAR